MERTELHRILDGLTPGRALDLACGRGETAMHLARRGWDVIAVDRDSAALATIQEHPRLLKRAMDLELESIEPFGVFDLIVAWRYYQPDLFAAIRAQLAPGGVFATATKTSGRFAAQLPDLRAQFSDWAVLSASESNGFAALLVQKPTLRSVK